MLEIFSDFDFFFPPVLFIFIFFFMFVCVMRNSICGFYFFFQLKASGMVKCVCRFIRFGIFLVCKKLKIIQETNETNETKDLFSACIIESSVSFLYYPFFLTSFLLRQALLLLFNLQLQRDILLVNKTLKCSFSCISKLH